MSDGSNPIAEFDTIEQVPKPHNINEATDIVLAGTHPSGANPGEVYLQRVPNFYIDENSNYYLRMVWQDGNEKGSPTVSDGMGVFVSEPYNGNNTLWFECTWKDAVGSGPPEGIFFVEVTAMVNGDKIKVKWGFQRDND